MYQQQQQMPQNYGYYPQPQIRMIPQGLKGRPVSSLDEVRATAVDFDGSIFYFPNLANDKIYTKQVNLDGTSSVRIYELVETPPPAVPAPQTDLVTKEEFTATINSLLEEISALKQSNAAAGPTPPVVQDSGNNQAQPQSASFNF